MTDGAAPPSGPAMNGGGEPPPSAEATAAPGAAPSAHAGSTLPSGALPGVPHVSAREGGLKSAARPETTAEADLVARLRAGDEGAFETLVRTYGGRLLSVAKRFFPNVEDAQDALQDAFISAFKSIDRFEGSSKLSTWLHQITVNAALMKLRTGRRRREEAIEDLLPKFLEDGHATIPAVDWREPADVMLQREETRAFVRASIDRLPESYRTVLLLRDIEGLDTEQTARLLGVNANAVKTRLHRARQALRTLLDERFREEKAR